MTPEENKLLLIRWLLWFLIPWSLNIIQLKYLLIFKSVIIIYKLYQNQQSPSDC